MQKESSNHCCILSNGIKQTNGKGFGSWKTTNRKNHVKTYKFSSKDVYLKEHQEAIYGEVQALGDTMMNIYEDLFTVWKEVVILHDM